MPTKRGPARLPRDTAPCDKDGGFPGQAVGSTMLTAQAWDEVGEGLGLSKRQIQIIQAVFDDQTERAIGEALGISAHTVHTHLERLYHKLEIRDRAQLVLRVFDQFMARTTVAGSRLPPICEHYRAGCCPIAPADPPRSEDAG